MLQLAIAIFNVSHGCSSMPFLFDRDNSPENPYGLSHDDQEDFL